MKLGQLVKMVMTQANEDMEDAEEYREMIIIYLNEGYRRMAEKYSPVIDLYGNVAVDGFIDLKNNVYTIRRVKRVEDQQSGREVSFEIRNGKLFVSGGEGPYNVTCTATPLPMEADTDEPLLPESAHMALADYATWRFYGNGNLSRQQRGEFYYRRFMMELERLAPEGQEMGGPRNFHSLFECT